MSKTGFRFGWTLRFAKANSHCVTDGLTVWRALFPWRFLEMDFEKHGKMAFRDNTESEKEQKIRGIS
jgi:hypothetical protein